MAAFHSLVQQKVSQEDTPHQNLKSMVVLRISWEEQINVRFLTETLNMTGDMGNSPVMIPSDP